MRFSYSVKRISVLLILLVIFVVGAAWPVAGKGIAQAGMLDIQDLTGQSQEPTTENLMYLPLVSNGFPWDSPFGVEYERRFSATHPAFQSMVDLEANYIRLNGRISWRLLQPVQGGPIDWSSLARFELELRALRVEGMTPIVVVDDYPDWATYKKEDGTPSNCGPLLENQFSAFASFMNQLVLRYKTSEYNVHIWELGNEPDVDTDLFVEDSQYGCWGDEDDPYYGGGTYGRMLMQVAPHIRAADPSAQVWIGGLLLHAPTTPGDNLGKPEQFFRGILAAGAAEYFDVVPFHAYVAYVNRYVDHDNALEGSPWYTLGGSILGKARLLKAYMAEYGVSKPLFVNEISLLCNESAAWCETPGQDFYQMQANFAVRTTVRGLLEGISGYTWFTIDGPGWRNSGLLDANSLPRPSYTAYQQLGLRLRYSKFVGPVSYGSEVEAYEFKHGNNRTHVVWALENENVEITVPESKFIEAWTRDGAPITPVSDGTGNFHITAQFEPIYIVRLP